MIKCTRMAPPFAMPSFNAQLQAVFQFISAFGQTTRTPHINPRKNWNPLTLALLLWSAAASAQTLDWAVHPYTPIGEETGGFDRAYANTIDAAGNQLVTGSFYGTGDFDPGPGTANLSTGNNEPDIFVAKYDASGNYLWAFQIGDSNLDEGLGIETDAGGNVYVTGKFRGTDVDFDPGPGTALLNSEEEYGAFVAKYSPSGAYQWAFVLNSVSASAVGFDLKIDGSGNVCVTGDINAYENDEIDLDPGAAEANFNLVGSIDYLFLAKYTASGTYLWAKITGGNGMYSRSMAIDANDNILLTGGYSGVIDFDMGPGTANLGSLGLNNDVFVAKYDGSGNFIWVFRVGGNGWDTGYGITTDAGGNVYITGSFYETDVDFDPGAGTALLSSAGESDAFIAKYSASAVYQWAVAIGDEDNDEGRGLVTDSESNLYATGFFRGNDVDFQPGAGTFTLSSFEGFTDVYVAKYSSGGTCAWVKNTRGGGTDEGRDIATDGDHVVVCGFFDGINMDFDPGPGAAEMSTYDDDALLWKLSSGGEYEWAIQMGLYPRNNSWDMSCRAIARDAAGNVYVTGTLEGLSVDFDPGPGEVLLNADNNSDIFIAKYDAAGNYLWVKLIGGSNTEVGTGIALDAAGNIYITTLIYYDEPIDFDPGPGTAILTPVQFAYQSAVIAKYTADGNYVWAKLIDNSVPEDIALDGSGRPYITGHFYGTNVDFDPGPGTALLSSPGDYLYDVFIAGFNADGTFNWAKSMGGGQNDYATDIATGADGSIYTTGYFESGDADFDPGAGTATLASAGQNDMFVAKYDNTGAYQWAYRIGGAENDAANNVALDADGNVYVTGEFMGADIDFDPGAGTTLLSSAGNSDIFVAKYTASGSLVWASRQGGADYADRGLGIAIDAGGQVYIAGDFDDANTPQSESDVFISQYDADGNSLLVSGSGAVTNCIAAGGDGQVVTGGTFQGTKDFDPGAGAVEFTAVSSLGDMFFAQYSFAPTEVTVSGALIWENDNVTGVGNATVAMSGDQTGSVTTSANGTYAFIVTPGSDLTITPTKTINKLNGLTAADVTAIQRHVANIAPLPAPFKRIAADVNKSNTITTQDASLINQALLGNQTALSQITSWRFVPSAYTFPNPNVPWGFPEKIVLTDVSDDVSGQDIKGIKLGDVVSTWANPANFGGGQPFVLRTQDQVLQAGQETLVEFRADQMDDLNSFQFALYFDPEHLQLLEIEPLAGLPMSMENFGAYNLSEGEIRTLWAQPASVLLSEAAPVFRLRFMALESGAMLSEVLHLNEEALPGHAYNSTFEESDVELLYSTLTGTDQPGAGAALSLENQPNPFVDVTTIRFVLPQAGETELRISDASGRLLYSQKKYYIAGRQEETLRLTGASGVLFAELVTEQGSVVRKMLAVR